MRSSYNKNMDKAKTEFHRNRIQAADSKELFSIVDKLSCAKGSSRQILPDLPDVFADYFCQKIVQIRSNLLFGIENENENDFAFSEHKSHPSCQFNVFEPVSVDDVLHIVRKMSAKTCLLDPMPTKLVKDCLDILAPILAHIVITSFDSGIFPVDCKEAIVSPLIKKTGLDRNVYKITILFLIVHV